jgi:putative phosphoribosyl transferase
MERRHTISIGLPPRGGEGSLGLPAAQPNGIVIFTHGRGSSRLSPRNAMVAESLEQAGLATPLFDLLTESEATRRRNVFDIALLAERLNLAVDWVADCAAGRSLPVGFFFAPAPAQRPHSWQLHHARTCAPSSVAAAGRTSRLRRWAR